MVTRHVSRLGLWGNFVWPTLCYTCVEKMFYMHAITKFQKGPHIEIQIEFQTMFPFNDSLYSLDVRHEDTYPENS